MATLRTLASVGSVCGRVTKLTDAARQVRSMARRRWRVAVGALCGFAFGVLSGVEASAQQDAQPQPQGTPPVATGTFTPGLCTFGDCELAAIVGGAPCKGAALSSAGARGSGCGQSRLYHGSAWRSCEQPDRQEFRVGRSRCRSARPDQASRATSATASRYCRQRPLVHRADPLRRALGSLHRYSDSVAAGCLGQLYRSVVVAMVAMGMMQPSIHQVIDMTAVRYGLVPTGWAMGV